MNADFASLKPAVRQSRRHGSVGHDGGVVFCRKF